MKTGNKLFRYVNVNKKTGKFLRFNGKGTPELARAELHEMRQDAEWVIGFHYLLKQDWEIKKVCMTIELL